MKLTAKRSCSGEVLRLGDVCTDAVRAGLAQVQNNQRTNEAACSVARACLDDPELREDLRSQNGMTNQAYDLCLSFVTHALAQLPLAVALAGGVQTALDTVAQGFVWSGKAYLSPFGFISFLCLWPLSTKRW